MKCVRDARNSWAARQRRPTENVKMFAIHPCLLPRAALKLLPNR